MTEDEFLGIWTELTQEVIDKIYPKGRKEKFFTALKHLIFRNSRRGEALRDFSIMSAKLSMELSRRGFLYK